MDGLVAGIYLIAGCGFHAMNKKRMNEITRVKGKKKKKEERVIFKQKVNW